MSAFNSKNQVVLSSLVLESAKDIFEESVLSNSPELLREVAKYCSDLASLISMSPTEFFHMYKGRVEFSPEFKIAVQGDSNDDAVDDELLEDLIYSLLNHIQEEEEATPQRVKRVKVHKVRKPVKLKVHLSSYDPFEDAEDFCTYAEGTYYKE